MIGKLLVKIEDGETTYFSSVPLEVVVLDNSVSSFSPQELKDENILAIKDLNNLTETYFVDQFQADHDPYYVDHIFGQIDKEK